MYRCASCPNIRSLVCSCPIKILDQGLFPHSLDRALNTVEVVPLIVYVLFQGHSSFVTHIDWSVDNQYLQSNSGDYEGLFCKCNNPYLKMLPSSYSSDT